MGPKELYLRLRPPLWARWTISIVVGIVVVVLLVRFVSHNTNNAEANISTAGERQELQQERILLRQDQAPQVAKIASGAVPEATLVAAIRRDMRRKIAKGTIDGPLGAISCRSATTRGPRTAYRCTISSAGVDYPFLAVADTSTHQVVYCKHDVYSAVPGQTIAVSPRCTLS